eukprot:3159085-Rhodomonas_salina.2
MLRFTGAMYGAAEPRVELLRYGTAGSTIRSVRAMHRPMMARGEWRRSPEVPPMIEELRGALYRAGMYELSWPHHAPSQNVRSNDMRAAAAAGLTMTDEFMALLALASCQHPGEHELRAREEGQRAGASVGSGSRGCGGETYGPYWVIWKLCLVSRFSQ